MGVREKEKKLVDGFESGSEASLKQVLKRWDSWEAILILTSIAIAVIRRRRMKGFTARGKHRLWNSSFGNGVVAVKERLRTCRPPQQLR